LLVYGVNEYMYDGCGFAITSRGGMYFVNVMVALSVIDPVLS